MHKSGHIGFSLFLSSIPVFILLRLEFAVFASIFIGSVAILSMLPDIDMKLRHISDSIEHRGVTHSLQFSLFIGVLYSVLALILTLLLYLMGNTQIFAQLQALTTLHPLLGYLFVFVSGVCGVLFHILGDNLICL